MVVAARPDVNCLNTMAQPAIQAKEVVRTE